MIKSLKTYWFRLLLVGIFVLVGKREGLSLGGIMFIGALSNYGEQFAVNCLRKFYAKAITPAICNTDYEGEIKKAGDRCSILSFLSDLTLTDYTVGTDMTVEHPADTEDQLIIDQKKYYDFDIDDVDKQFSYVEDEDSTLIENAGKVLDKTIDTFVLAKVTSAKAGHRIGADYVVTGDGDTTKVSITTAGAVTLTKPAATAGFDSTMVGKGLLVSSYGTEKWYRISAVTNSAAATITEWDDGAILTDPEDSDTAIGGTGYGFTVEGYNATQLTKTNIYSKICDLATVLDEDEIPDSDRHFTVPAWVKNLLVQASDLTPDIAMYHEEKVINGKCGRVAGFDVHIAPGSRVATSLGTDGVRGWDILANHRGFITFGHKWSESRVINAEKQFANLYQGLNLYGAAVAIERRKCGSLLFVKQ